MENVKNLKITKLFQSLENEKTRFRIEQELARTDSTRTISDCRSHLSPSNFNEPKDILEKTRTRKDISEKYAWFFKFLREGKTPNACLQYFCKQWLDDRAWLLIDNNSVKKVQERGFEVPQEKAFSWFPAFRRGEKRYQDLNRQKLYDTSEIFSTFYKYSYFITLTFDPAKLPIDLTESWKFAQKEVNKFLKNLQKRFNGAYVRVVESHASGICHYHIAFYTDKILHQKWQIKTKRNGAKYLSTGTIKNAVNKLWTHGFNEINLVYGEKGSSKYLAKYLAKGFSSEVSKLCIKDELTKTDRKFILTFALPLLSGLRSWSSSEIKTVLAKMSPKQIAKVSNKNQILGDYLQAVQKKKKALAESNTNRESDTTARSAVPSPAKRATLLDCLSNKIPCSSYVELYKPDKLLINPHLKPDFDPNKEFQWLKNLQIRVRSKKVGCQGCVFTELQRLAVLGVSKLFGLPKGAQTPEAVRYIKEICDYEEWKPDGFELYEIDIRFFMWLFPKNPWVLAWSRRPCWAQVKLQRVQQFRADFIKRHICYKAWR